MKNFSIVIIIILNLFSSFLLAETTNLNNYFIPNLVNAIDEEDTNKYIVYSNDCNIYFSNDRISFVFKSKFQNTDSISLFRVDLKINSTSNTKLIALKPESVKLNFYNPEYPNGIKNVDIFNEMVYENVLENVNLHFHFKDNKLNYFFEGHKENISNFKFEFTGIESFSQEKINPKSLLIKSEVAVFNFSISDFSKIAIHGINIEKSEKYHYIPELKNFESNLQYKENDNLLGGELSWITYLGGSSFDHLYCIDADENSDLLLCGLTNSFDFPSTIGSYQESKNGNEDAIVLKIDKNSKIIWCTFLGGSNADRAMNIVKRDSIIWVSGESLSYDFPVTANAHQKNYSGGSADILIMRLDMNGHLLHATYHGGDAYDSSPDLAVDSKHNVWLVGRTFSSVFPVTSNAFYPNRGNFYDAFILSLDKEGKLRYSSLFPGNQDVYGEGIAVDSFDNICITGFTLTENLPVSQNAYQSTKKGYYDAYLAKFNNIGKPIWMTYFGGSRQDYGSNLTVDPYGNYFIFGFTNSIDLPTNANVFQPNLRGNFDSFIAKFNQDGEFQWVSYFGGNSNEGIGESILYQIGGVKSDKYGNILVSGKTNSNDLPLTTDAFQKTLKGQSDAFIAKFDVNGNLLYSTFLGGSSNERGYDVSMDNEGYLVNVGWTESNDFPVTANAFQKNYKGGIDAYIYRFKECEEFFEFEINISNDTLLLAEQNNSIPVLLKFYNSPPKIEKLNIKFRFVNKYFENIKFSNGKILNTETNDKYIIYELLFENVDVNKPKIEICKISFNSKLPSDFKTKIEIVDFDWNILCSNTKIKDAEIFSECDIPIETLVYLKDTLTTSTNFNLPLYLSTKELDKIFIKYNLALTIKYDKSKCELIGLTNGNILNKIQNGIFEECLIKINKIEISDENNIISYLNFAFKGKDTTNVDMQLLNPKWYEPCIESNLIGASVKKGCNPLIFSVAIQDNLLKVNNQINQLPLYIKCETEPNFTGVIKNLNFDLSISNVINEISYDGLNLLDKSEIGNKTNFRLSKDIINMKNGESTFGYINFRFIENQNNLIDVKFDNLTNTNICYSINSSNFSIPTVCDSLNVNFQIQDTVIPYGFSFKRILKISIDNPEPFGKDISILFKIKPQNRSLRLTNVTGAEVISSGFENSLSFYHLKKIFFANSTVDSLTIDLLSLFEDADSCQIQIVELSSDYGCVSLNYPKIATVGFDNLCMEDMRLIQYFNTNYLSVFPNPTSENINISLNCIDNGNLNLKILDQLGNQIYEKKFFKDSNISNLSENFEIDIRDFASGIYFLQFSTSNQFITKKIIITKE